MTEVTTENKFGSNCSGAEGDINRVLILSNNNLTLEDGFILALGGFVLAYGTDYLVNHLTASSTVTFVGPVYNAQPITILYFSSKSVAITTSGISTKIDMVRKIIQKHGQGAALRRIVNNRDGFGGITSYSNTDYAIRWLQQPITEKDRNLVEMGLAVSGDQKGFFYPYYTSTDTGVIGPDIIVTVGDVITDLAGIKWRIEQKIGGRIADGIEIFSVAIVRRLDMTA